MGLSDHLGCVACSTEGERKRTVLFLSVPSPGRLARHVGGVNGGACAIAVRRRGAIDVTDATWTMSGEGAATPNLQILVPR
jgi:hypothetical protein